MSRLSESRWGWIEMEEVMNGKGGDVLGITLFQVGSITLGWRLGWSKTLRLSHSNYAIHHPIH